MAAKGRPAGTMLKWALALTRAWTRFYTSGMPPALAEARRAEIEAALWAPPRDPTRPDGGPTAGDVLLRLVRGLPDDVLWSMDLMDLRTRRRRTRLWLAAAVSVAAISALWVRSSLDTTLPQPPLSPVKMQAWLMSPVPPPPPPPPPPLRLGSTMNEEEWFVPPPPPLPNEGQRD